MIIGNGDIAKILPNNNLLFFASGVSNSKEERESEYQREKDLLLEQDKNNHIVYFSSLCTLYLDTRYARHKREMEQLVKTFKTYTIIRIGNTNYCIGQRMCLCEIQNDTIIMVAQFVTSSRNVNLPHSVLKDYDNQPRYYAPKCIITSRYWDKRIPYDEQDAKRDKLMGVGSNHVIRYKGSVALPNFLHMTPSPEFSRASAYCNGIHEFAVGGNTPGFYMGTPISLGCVRLHSYPSKFVRWWTPNNARLFIAYEYQNYIKDPKIK